MQQFSDKVEGWLSQFFLGRVLIFGLTMLVIALVAICVLPLALLRSAKKKILG